VFPHDERRRKRLVALLAASLAALAALGIGLVRAAGAGGLTAPVISTIGLPPHATRETAAAFMFTNARTVAFRCALDGRAATPCGTGVFGRAAYRGPLAAGPHTFHVVAVTATETSEPASYSWTVLASPGGGDDSGGGEGGAGAGAEAPVGPQRPFVIVGDVDGLAPGVTKTIALSLRNPGSDPIYVTSVAVEISEESTPPGCPSGPNIALEQAAGITASDPVRIDAHASVLLTTFPRAPRIGFRNQPWNQDVCKGKSFALRYTGSAHS